MPIFLQKNKLFNFLTYCNIRILFALIITFSLFGCTQSKTTQENLTTAFNPIDPTMKYKVLSERSLFADGYMKGIDTYQLIKNFAGPKSIEAPDLYSNNHPGKPHIVEATDDVVGDHFVFSIHKAYDKDRDVSSIKDRQRNEIKAYAKSSNELKAYKNEILSYNWKFKLNKGISVSKNFTHFFQLKAVDGGVGTPILTLSGRNKNGEWLEVIHTIHGKKTLLKKVPLQALKGRWLQVSCVVHYRNNGQLQLLITDLANEPIIELSLNNIDMLRGENRGDFVRPKWGIYRSLRSKEMLRDAEEKVFFADFSVQKFAIKSISSP